jgi:HSP20 family molecular chaperone IbpA
MAKSFFEKLASSLNMEKDELGIDGYPQEESYEEELTEDPTASPEEQQDRIEEDDENAELIPDTENEQESSENEEWNPEELTGEFAEENTVVTQMASSSKKPQARLAIAKSDFSVVPQSKKQTIQDSSTYDDPLPGIKKKSLKSSVEKSETPPHEEEEAEGQLAIDVYQTENDIVIKSTIAGVEAQDLDITIEEDMVTIRGSRKKDDDAPGANYFYQECYWGPFSRSVILPMEIDSEQSEASFKNGILTIRLSKLARHKKKKITVTGG